MVSTPVWANPVRLAAKHGEGVVTVVYQAKGAGEDGLAGRNCQNTQIMHALDAKRALAKSSRGRLVSIAPTGRVPERVTDWGSSNMIRKHCGPAQANWKSRRKSEDRGCSTNLCSPSSDENGRLVRIAMVRGCGLRAQGGCID